MYFKEPLISTNQEDIFHLAPIPVFRKVFTDHFLHDEVYEFGKKNLTKTQKRMGQELVGQHDKERMNIYKKVAFEKNEWIEETEKNPIGSRYHVPPNNLLDIEIPSILEIRKRIENSFIYLVDSLGFEHDGKPQITESWAQYYAPFDGRGQTHHNHARWQAHEEPRLGFSGGYYLSDGKPKKDHPYSGVFTFHIRGMSYFIRPQKGMLIIWPNDIVHSVKPFFGEEDRCVINFNIQFD